MCRTVCFCIYSRTNADRARNFNTSSFWLSPVTAAESISGWAWSADNQPFLLNQNFLTQQYNQENCLMANQSQLYNLTTLDCGSTDVSTVVCMFDSGISKFKLKYTVNCHYYTCDILRYNIRLPSILD